MSMSPDPQNFDALRRLLALKRFEQPPPRYFNEFSAQVIARIREGETAADTAGMQRLFIEMPWLQRIWAAFEAKPMLAGAFGVGLCAVLITGVVYSERPVTAPEQVLSAPAGARLELANQ